MSDCLYKEIIESKTGTKLPVLKSGKTIESRYNPEKDIDRQLENLENIQLYYIVFGAGSGLLIEKLSETGSIILVVENSYESLKFLEENLPVYDELKKNKNIYFSTLNDFSEDFIATYLPALHGNLKIIPQIPWLNEQNINLSDLNEIIKFSLKKISADFSVQTHFGKIWQNNILNNINFLNSKTNISIDHTKKAAIIAAGPTLDYSISKLINNREKYVLIATDTALSILLKHEIYPEIVISVDGQNVSYNHFLHDCKQLKKTIFAFDLCGNFSAINHYYKKGMNLFFFKSGHPLSEFIDKYNCLTSLYTGSGTVTISAVDLSLKLGFSEIEIYGADFAYVNNKSYSKGTYLDMLYNKSCNKIFPVEYQYSKLMYRTELQQIEKGFTNDILKSYKSSLEKYLASKQIEFYKNNDIYYLSNKNISNMDKTSKESYSFKNDLIINNIIDSKNHIIIAPYIAWARFKYKIESLDQLVKLAYSSLVRYN